VTSLQDQMQGILTEGEGSVVSTVNLLVKIVCFVNKIIFVDSKLDVTSLRGQIQGILTEGEGSVQLTSRLNSMFCKKICL